MTIRTNSPIDTGTTQPVFTPPKEEKLRDPLVEEGRKLKQDNFPALSQYIEGKISYYSQYFPDGKAIVEKDKKERDAYWQAATVINAELRDLLEFIRNV